jgi:prohibitin 2
MSMPPNARQAWSALTKMAQQAQRQGGSSGGPSPKGVGAGVGGLVLLVGGGLVVNNALFNVDGGHRAIKYTRIGGVKQEIFSEGMLKPIPPDQKAYTYVWMYRHTFQDSMV